MKFLHILLEWLYPYVQMLEKRIVSYALTDISCVCTAALPAVKKPECNINIGYPVAMVVKKTTGVISTSCNAPTAAEFTTAFAETGDNKCSIIWLENVTGPVKEEEQIASGKTVNGKNQLIGLTKSITGQVNRMDHDYLEFLYELSCFDELDLWYITNANYCVGGADGMTGSMIIEGLTVPGFGEINHTPVKFIYDAFKKKDYLWHFDSNYATLDNLGDSGTTTEGC